MASRFWRAISRTSPTGGKLSGRRQSKRRPCPPAPTWWWWAAAMPGWRRPARWPIRVSRAWCWRPPSSDRAPARAAAARSAPVSRSARALPARASTMRPTSCATSSAGRSRPTAGCSIWWKRRTSTAISSSAAVSSAPVPPRITRGCASATTSCAPAAPPTAISSAAKNSARRSAATIITAAWCWRRRASCIPPCSTAACWRRCGGAIRSRWRATAAPPASHGRVTAGGLRQTPARCRRATSSSPPTATPVA